MFLGLASKPQGKGIHDVTKQLLTWVFTGNRKISRSVIANERFKAQSVGASDRREKDDLFENLEDLDEDEFHRKPERNNFNRYKRHDRYDRRDHFDSNNNYTKNRFDRYDRYDRHDRYDRNKYERQSFNRPYGNAPKVKNINWDSEELTSFKKDFYNPKPEVLNRSDEIMRFYEAHDIIVRGENCPPPVFSFEELGLPDKILALLKSLNYTEPTPIQSQGCPIALSGRNMVGISRTGSGKTLAYILPAIVHISNQPALQTGDGPIALVVSPTRELVQQIKGVSNAFRSTCNIVTTVAYGGVKRSQQAIGLTSGAHICVATPGRLLDFLNAGTTNLKRCTYLVLDEADRMFDMGFEPQVREIIEHIRPDRQVLMWSATWPKDIRNLAEEYLEEYIQVKIGSSELTANPNIKQIVHVCREMEKRNLLLKILNEATDETGKKTLIFTRTKKTADQVAYWLNSKGFRSVVMHGDKSQSHRDHTLRSFRSGRVLYLIATGVAARGLDVQDISYVINYDFPDNTEDYVHRIGRTARHKNFGTAHSFFTEADVSKAHGLLDVLKKCNQEINPQLLELINVNRFYKRRHSY